MVLLPQIYNDEQILLNFLILISDPISKVYFFFFVSLTGLQAGLLIPVSPEPRSCLVFQLQANNLSGVWKSISGGCDSARNQECL